MHSFAMTTDAGQGGLTFLFMAMAAVAIVFLSQIFALAKKSQKAVIAGVTVGAVIALGSPMLAAILATAAVVVIFGSMWFRTRARERDARMYRAEKMKADAQAEAFFDAYNRHQAKAQAQAAAQMRNPRLEQLDPNTIDAEFTEHRKEKF